MKLLDKIFPKKAVQKDEQESVENKKSIKETLQEKKEQMKKGIVTGDPEVWHHVLMGVTITFIGIGLIFAIIMNFMFELQMSRMQDRPIAQTSVNAKLPPGEYRVIGFNYIPGDDGTTKGEKAMFLVAAKDGGVVIDALPVEGTKIPEDFYSSECYILNVEASGEWSFKPTEMLNKIRAAEEQQKNNIAVHTQEQP